MKWKRQVLPALTLALSCDRLSLRECQWRQPGARPKQGGERRAPRGLCRPRAFGKRGGARCLRGMPAAEGAPGLATDEA